MYSLRRFMIAGLWLGLSNALTTRGSEPIPPSKDPWYTAPDGFEKATPGTVLRIRPAPGDLPSLVGNTSEAYNVLYRTTDARNNPSWSVTTLLLPENANRDSTERKSLVSYQLAYDTPAVDWGPSYALYKGVSTVPIEIKAISALLSRGWYVSVPDYEGPLAAFGSGFQSAHSILDTLRVASSLHDIIGAGASDMQFALWGYSGGAHASGWAAELRAQYAPEVNIVAAAIGGIPASIQTVAKNTNRSPLSGLIVAMSLGLVAEFPEANETLSNAMNEYGLFNREGYYKARTRHLVANYDAYTYQDIAFYFTNGEMPFDIPVMQELIKNQSDLGNHGVPTMSYYMYATKIDLITGIIDTDNLVNKYCAAGANIMYERNAVGDHLAEAINTEDKVMDWFKGVFDGSITQTGCNTTDVSYGSGSSSNGGLS